MSEPTPKEPIPDPFNEEGLTFERALHRLQFIAEAIQQDELGLDESLKLFEEGNTLVQFCQKYLDQAEMKMNQISSRAAPNERKPLDGEDFRN